MAVIVRLFTAASVIALGGFAATSSMLACSSTSTTVTEGDDDDDDDDDSTTKDAGGGGAKDDAGSTKEPPNTAVCDAYAAAGNSQDTRRQITIAETANGFLMTIDGVNDYALALLKADDRCQLAGGEQPIGQKTLDANEKEIDVKLSPSHLFDFDGAKVSSKTVMFVQSDPAGAPGTPCTMVIATEGTRTGGDAGAGCNPVGTYALDKAVYTVSK
ncbi:MAG: hypothetical protein KIT84_14340 [Labilithrix sp.]|nr:hypothetical protein [Labilithrix sp.]MCW5812201.1 hypothetical protein [Labilithrix sp.]